MNEPIKDKAPKPPGLLPKNVQSWVIVGIALLMVVIMWLTGGKKPQATGKTAAPTVQAPAPVEVNETKIAELQTRIQDLQKQQLAAAECARAANPPARIFAAGTVAGTTQRWSEQCPSCRR